MNEAERLAKVKAALQSAVIRTVEAEGFLEDAAEDAGLFTEKTAQIWQLKRELNHLGVRIIELSKT